MCVLNMYEIVCVYGGRRKVKKTLTNRDTYTRFLREIYTHKWCIKINEIYLDKQKTIYKIARLTLTDLNLIYGQMLVKEKMKYL